MTAAKRGASTFCAMACAGAMALPALLLATPEAIAEPVAKGDTIEGTRDARYCELIPVVREGLHLTATVYNTLGLNDCPPAVWDAITEEAMKQRFDALTVLLNGPRHFLMDSITAGGATKAGKTIEAGGLQLTERASIDVGLMDLMHRPYREVTIDRDTIYRFKAGEPRVHARSTGRQPLRHAGLFTDR